MNDLVVLDREIVGEDYNVFIGGDNLKIGKGLGQYALEKLGKKLPKLFSPLEFLTQISLRKIDF